MKDKSLIKRSSGIIPKGLFGALMTYAATKYLKNKYLNKLNKLKLNNYTTGNVPMRISDPLGRGIDETIPYTKPYVYDTTTPGEMAPDTSNLSGAPMTIINLDGNWNMETPRLVGNIRSVKYTNGDRYFTLGKDMTSGKEMLLDYYDGNAYFDNTQLDLDQIKRNIYPRLNPKYKFGGTLNYFSKGKRLYF